MPLEAEAAQVSPERPHLDRYARQMRLPEIGHEGQVHLLASRVLVLGVGALGTHLASGLVRAGVGHVRLVDRDFVEVHNLQRQVLFDEEDAAANLPKAVAAARKLKKVNSKVVIEPVVTDVTYRNVESLVRDCDVVVDGSDNFEVRMLLCEACARHHVPWIYGAVLATHGVIMPILPDDGPCFHDLVPSLPTPGTMPTCETAGVLGTVPQVIAALEVTEALKILTGHPERLVRELRWLDLWTGEFMTLDVQSVRSDPCPVCDEEQYEFLTGKRAGHATTLCGTNAVQIHPQEGTELDFLTLAERLSPLGDVTHNDYLLRFSLPPHEIVLFRNGRAIIRGVEDLATARTLYTRYIGH